MRNYSQSTQDFASDVINGIEVETSAMANATYMAQTQQTLFNVYGRIKVNILYGEVVTDASADATTLKFRFQSTTPAIAVADMTAASGSLASAVPGTRVACLGGAVATGALVDAGPGITGSMSPMIIGTVGGIGLIAILTATANQTSGTTKFVIDYVPLDDGAYVTAAH